MNDDPFTSNDNGTTNPTLPTETPWTTGNDAQNTVGIAPLAGCDSYCILCVGRCVTASSTAGAIVNEHCFVKNAGESQSTVH